MIKKVSSDFLLKTKDKKLLRFLYNENFGVFYETIINNKVINKSIICKNCLKYFYVIEDDNRNINILYQDLIGNIILCILKENSTTYRTIFYNKHNFISPANIKGFSLRNKFMFLYNFDSNANKMYFCNNRNKTSGIIYYDKNDIDISYKILLGKEYSALVIYSISFNIFKLILKTYNAKSESWVNNKNVFISNHPYTDISFCIIKNKVHSLIITDEVNSKSLIYINNDLDKVEYIQRELIIHEDYDIESCLVIELDKVLWLLWISKGKMYGCYSLDSGESFSKAKDYLDNIEDNIKKIELVEGGQNKEIYIKDNNGNIDLFLEELLKYNNSFDINYKEISYNFKDKKEISSQLIKR